MTPQEGAAAFPGKRRAGGEGAPGTGNGSRAAFTARGQKDAPPGRAVPANPSQATFWKQIYLAHFTRSPKGFPLLSSPFLSGQRTRSFCSVSSRDAATEQIQNKAAPTEAPPRDPQLVTYHGKP